ncbi:hypothetical protein [Pontibacter burrus]|uniref:Uncharacterized protein n=1 Tax=Pontibacter burrus TaxID=2704466 RepID=A0A6B3LMI2_9BACT|nr:hypothetical protein [Pontibacter burrus]NEM97949.1 hypothetical protein [Pontibacter burrus]
MLCWCVLAFVAISCEESFVTPDPEARGLNYYPLKVGQYRIYDVTDIHYQNNVATKERFQMREWVADSFLDQTNALTYKIIRSIRPDAQAEWLDDSVMTVTKDHNRVILTKDNTRYVKMVFPVKEGNTWEPDVYNTRKLGNGKREQAKFAFVGQTYPLNNAVYDNTVMITFGEPPLLETKIDQREEVYAWNVGRIYRLFDRKELEECLMNCDPEKPFILDGHKRTEVLIEHGKL